MPNRHPSRLFPSLSLAGRPLRHAALIAALAVAPLAIAVSTTGAEFRVNVDTTGNQIPFGAVRLATGDRVVAWTSNSPNGVGLYAQRYANDASPRGQVFRLDTGDSSAALNTNQASLVATSEGFAVAWDGQRAGFISRQGGVWLRRFDANGTALEPAVAVNTAGGGNFGFANAQLSADASGKLVVAYTANSATADSNLAPVVRAQRFAADGTREGSELTVSPTQHNLIGLSHRPDGGFAVLMASASSGQTSLQNYAADGSVTADAAAMPGVNVANGTVPLWLNNTEFLLPEYRGDPTGPNNSQVSHYTLGRFGSNGALIGNRVEVSDCTPLYGDGPMQLSRRADGRLLTAFHCPRDGGTSPGGSSFQQQAAAQGVFVREFDANLVPTGPELPVNEYINDVQDLPQLLLDADGNGLLAWRSAGQDGSDAGVYARRVALDGAGVIRDDTPDAFTFVDVEPATRGVESRSNSITVTGINVPTAISVSGGEYGIGCANFTAAAGTVANGDTVCVRHTTATLGSTRTDTTLTMGGVSDTYSTVTAADPSGPAADLAISVTDDPDPVPAGGTLSYTVRIRNNSVQTASSADLVVDLKLSQAVGSFSASGDTFQCSGDLQGQRCVHAARLNGGEQTALVVLVTAPSQAGSLQLTATVTQPGDPDLSNNQASQSTTISASDPGSSGTVTDPQGRVVAVQLDGGQLENLRSVTTPSTAPGADYGLGFFAFEASAVAPGGSLTVTVTLPSGTTASGLVKCVAGNCASYPATVTGQTLQFTVVDNGAGDSDPTPGRISDPFGVVTLGSAGGGSIDVSSSGGALGFWGLLPLWMLLARRRRRS